MKIKTPYLILILSLAGCSTGPITSAVNRNPAATVDWEKPLLKAKLHQCFVSGAKFMLDDDAVKDRTCGILKTLQSGDDYMKFVCVGVASSELYDTLVSDGVRTEQRERRQDEKGNNGVYAGDGPVDVIFLSIDKNETNGSYCKRANYHLPDAPYSPETECAIMFRPDLR